MIATPRGPRRAVDPIISIDAAVAFLAANYHFNAADASALLREAAAAGRVQTGPDDVVASTAMTLSTGRSTGTGTTTNAGENKEEDKNRLGADENAGSSSSTAVARPNHCEEGQADATTWLRFPGPGCKPGWAIRSRPERHAVTLTLVETEARERGTAGEGGGNCVILRDETMLADRMHRRCPRLTEMLYMVSQGLFVGVFVGLPLFPIAFVEMTNSTQILFGGSDAGSAAWNITTVHVSSGSYSNLSSMPLPNASLNISTGSAGKANSPWSAGVGNAAVATFSVTMVCASINQVGQMVFAAHPVMLRRLWAKEWPSLVMRTGTAWAYAIAASTIQPHYGHVLFLVCWKIVQPVFLVVIDAIAVGTHLRMHPDLFKQIVSDRDKKINSAGTIVPLAVLFVIILVDIARHYLIVDFSQNFHIVTLNVTNPFNNRPVTFDNTDLASALFWGSTIFMAQSVWTIFTTKVYQQTLLDITNYHIATMVPGDVGERASHASHTTHATAFASAFVGGE